MGPLRWILPGRLLVRKEEVAPALCSVLATRELRGWAAAGGLSPFTASLRSPSYARRVPSTSGSPATFTSAARPWDSAGGHRF